MYPKAIKYYATKMTLAFFRWSAGLEIVDRATRNQSLLAKLMNMLYAPLPFYLIVYLYLKAIKSYAN